MVSSVVIWIGVSLLSRIDSFSPHHLATTVDAVQVIQIKVGLCLCGGPGGNSARSEKAASNRCPVLIKPLIEPNETTTGLAEITTSTNGLQIHSLPRCRKSPQLSSRGDQEL
jgi:hypothetical protein